MCKKGPLVFRFTHDNVPSVAVEHQRQVLRKHFIYLKVLFTFFLQKATEVMTNIKS